MSYQPLTSANINYHSDDELLPALKKRDEGAIRYIYHNYWPVVIKLVKTNRGNEEEAKDVFQESMLDFLEKVWSENFVLTCKIRTYFYSVFRNKWFHHLRGARSFVDIEEYVAVDVHAEETAPGDTEWPDSEQIKNAIISLGEPCRSLLIGFYYERASMELLAAKLGYKDAKVAKQQKFRCKDRLTQAISKFLNSASMEETSKDELIEQYLLGNLSGDPLRSFNEKLAADSGFKKEVELQKALIQHIKTAGREEWKLKLENLHKEMEQGSTEERKTARVIPLKWFREKKYMLGAAAMVIVVLVSALLLQNGSAGNERIFTAYYKPYANIEQSTRSVPAAAPTERGEAFHAYDKGDYIRSIGLFKKVLEKGEDEVALFYLGNAYLSANRYQEAETVFKDYLNRYREFALESGWYLSLAYIRQGKIKEARPLLEELVKRKSSFSKEAGEILSKKYKA